mmetsp:Transcript_5996/g.25094  ORF Transcript_5996/g.25094 Transcript_5996/m.25094 type:complete len:326 (-) Transcript_5996:224-1201(-)|eukprot:CAMPEP_0185712904 /NCGR_PEP_ID=MMETSP1164-20130828/35766_1 /TAXON_ID=1104430 /ORGANISM="Chrysoreinhardia sp, Strain CCMP2950" /LENGTH=325 /DNA_ID=CAMNT_0028380463 /DNA_START=115 /DNA_END=1092 /DNA_ORIENTATION=+
MPSRDATPSGLPAAAPPLNNGMRLRYLAAFGRHRPRCHGRCLVAEVDAEHNAVPASLCLIVVPTVLFVVLVPFRQFWAVSIAAVGLLGLSVTYLLAAMYTEPGILPIDPSTRRRGTVTTDESGRRRTRVTHVLVDGERHELADFRAKMCRQTENCIEEFDHFCPWVGNAVGRRNYRYFVAFITTVAFLALVVGASACLRLVRQRFGTDGRGGDIAFSWTEVVLMVLFAYTLIALCSVCGLVCFHARLIAINQTTNENIRGTYFSTKNPHDAGAWANVATFFTRPIPHSKVVSFVGGTHAPVRQAVPDDDEGDDDDEPQTTGVEMV